MLFLIANIKSVSTIESVLLDYDTILSYLFNHIILKIY